MRGESDVEIQHKARWASTKQLKTYDMSDQDDSLKIALAKRGLINENRFNFYLPKTKTCNFCGFDKIGFTEDTCPQCLHIIDGTKLKKYIKAEKAVDNFFTPEIQKLFKIVYKLQDEITRMKQAVN
ncbi:hypothetical protein ACFL6G_04110 [candidate division KSB1 bacterium]